METHLWTESGLWSGLDSVFYQIWLTTEQFAAVISINKHVDSYYPCFTALFFIYIYFLMCCFLQTNQRKW